MTSAICLCSGSRSTISKFFISYSGATMATLTALEMQLYCEILSHRSSASFYDSAVFDTGTYQILSIIFEQIKPIMPREVLSSKSQST